MAVEFLQGFEQVAPTSAITGQVLPTELADYFGFDLPLVTTDWFLNSAGTQSDESGPMVTDTDYRVEGQSLRIERPDVGAFQASYNGTIPLPLTRTLGVATPKAILGFAVKYSRTPMQSIPLAEMHYTQADGDGHISLWADPDGALFIATVKFDVDATEPYDAPLPFETVITPAGTLNLQRWTYVELAIDCSTETVRLELELNGKRTLYITSNTLVAIPQSEAVINSVTIYNPQNTYFGGGYGMYLDDIYVANGLGTENINILGPQWVMFVGPDRPHLTDFTVKGDVLFSREVAARKLDKEDLSHFLEVNQYVGGAETFHVPLLRNGMGFASAMTVTGFISTENDPEVLYVKIIEGDEVQERTMPFSEPDPVRFEFYTNLAPNGGVLTARKLRELQIEVGV